MGFYSSSSRVSRVPMQLWQANVLAFLLLFIVGAGIFGVQMHRLICSFLEEARDHARLAAGIILLNTRHAMTAEQLMEEFFKNQLSNSARFVSYLDSIEPFTAAELTAFAQETGLAGVRIVRDDGTTSQGPEGWLPRDCNVTCLQGSDMLLHLNRHHLLIYTRQDVDTGTCVYLGVQSTQIEELQQRIGVKKILDEIGQLHGIAYARLVNCHAGRKISVSKTRSERLEARLIKDRDLPVVEVTIPLSCGRLLLGIDASPLRDTRHRMMRYFLVFSLLLFVVGAVLTLWLYRFQLGYMERVREYERELSEQREDAALGRAAAGIAHEIRNPLNSVGMGLQRLKFEFSDMEQSQRDLVSLMLQEIRRTDSIISGLLSYSRPVRINALWLDLSELVEEQLALVRHEIGQKKISASFDLPACRLEADPDLMRQLVQNLVKNAMEALEPGGRFEVSLQCLGHKVVLSISNRFSGQVPEDSEQLFEPYFTTKTRGNGLGLAICRRIVKAHSGYISVTISRAMFTVTVILPRRAERRG